MTKSEGKAALKM